MGVGQVMAVCLSGSLGGFSCRAVLAAAPLELSGVAPPLLRVCVSWARAWPEVFFSFLLSSQGNVFTPHLFKPR